MRCRADDRAWGKGLHAGAAPRTQGAALPAGAQFCAACGRPVTATSANPAHEAPAKTAAEVRAYFGDAIDLIVDDGAARTDQPSTVVDARGNEAKLIREGVIAWAEIEKKLNRVAEVFFPLPLGEG